MYKLRIDKDDNKILNIFEFDPNAFVSNQTIQVQSDNLSMIKDLFAHFNSIEIFRDQNPIAEYTVYDSYSEITYNGRRFSSIDNNYFDCLSVKLTKADIISQVQRLDEKINPVINENNMTIEELKAYRIGLISKAGEADIFAGDQVTFDDGTTKTYTFGLDDQNNLQTYLSLIAQIPDKSKVAIPYHAVGEMCQNYTAKQIVEVYFTLQVKLLRVYTYVNMLRLHINSLTNREEIMNVEYGMELPQQYQEQMAMIMSESLATIMEIKEQYNFDDTGAVDQNEEETVEGN